MDLLIVYNREDGFETDWKEKLGNAALGALRLAFGKMVTVTARKEMKVSVAESSQKAIAIAALILLSPIYLIAIPIGFAATLLSSTYGKSLPFVPYIPALTPPPQSPESSTPENATPKETKPAAKPPLESPKPPEPLKPARDWSSFGLADRVIDLINRTGAAPLTHYLKNPEDIRDYILQFKDKMDVLFLENVDLTQEKTLFEGHNFRTVKLSACKITQEQAFILTSKACVEEIILTNGTLPQKIFANIFILGKSKIDLSHNGLTDEAIRSKAFLQSFRDAKEINLEGNNLTDKFFEIFTEHNSPTGLKSFNVSRNQITDEGLLKAYKALTGLRYCENVNFSHNQITEEGFRKLSDSYPLTEIAKLQFHSDKLNLADCRKIAAISANNYGKKGALLDAGFSPKELGIRNAYALKMAYANCRKRVEILDLHDIDLSNGNDLSDVLLTDAILSTRHIRLNGCCLTENGLRKLISLSRFESIEISNNPTLDLETVKDVFDGQIPENVKFTPIEKREPSNEDFEKLNQLLNEQKKKILQSQRRITELKQSLLTSTLDYVVKFRELKGNEKFNNKTQVRFTFSKRLGFELSPEAVTELDKLMDAVPFDREAFLNVILKYRNASSIKEVIIAQLNEVKKEGRTDLIQDEIEVLFTKNNIAINKEAKALIQEIASFGAAAKSLDKHLALTEDSLLRIIINRANSLRAAYDDNQIIDEILNVITYSSVNKDELKQSLQRCIQNDFSYDAIKACICKAVNIKNISSSDDAKRILPDVTEEEIKNYLGQ